MTCKPSMKLVSHLRKPLRLLHFSHRSSSKLRCLGAERSDLADQTRQRAHRCVLPCSLNLLMQSLQWGSSLLRHSFSAKSSLNRSAMHGPRQRALASRFLYRCLFSRLNLPTSLASWGILALCVTLGRFCLSSLHPQYHYIHREQISEAELPHEHKKYTLDANLNLHYPILQQMAYAHT